MEGVGERNRRAAGVEGIAIGDHQVDAVAEVAGVYAAVRDAVVRYEANPGQPGVVEVRSELEAVDPRRPEPLEGLVGSPPDREIGRLERADGGVEQRLLEVADVRRWVDPH